MYCSFITMFTKNHLCVLIWITCPVQNRTHYFFKIWFNINFHLCLGLSSGPIASGFKTEILYSRSAHLIIHSWFNHSNNIKWLVQIMQFCNMQLQELLISCFVCPNIVQKIQSHVSFWNDRVNFMFIPLISSLYTTFYLSHPLWHGSGLCMCKRD